MYNSDKNSRNDSNLSADEKVGQKWCQRIKSHRAEVQVEAKEWKKDFSSYRAKHWHAHKDTDQGPQGSDLQVPYLNSFVDVMISNIVPPHPACDIRTRRKAKKASAKLRTVYANDLLSKDSASWKLRRASALTAIQGRCALKMVWSSKRQRPRCRVIPANRFYFDSSAEEWDDIRYFIEVVPMRKEEVRRASKNSNPKNKDGAYKKGTVERLEGEFKPLPSWVDDPAKAATAASRQNEEYLIVYEVHDFESGKMYHIVEGQFEPLFISDLPYPRLKNPFHLISFLDNLTDLAGNSHAQMIREPVNRLNELMTMTFEHTRMLVPTLFVHAERVDAPDEIIEALDKKTSANQAILVETAKRYDMRDVLEWGQTPQVPPDYTRLSSVLQETIEVILALPAYSRGQVGNADVATELALVDTAQKTRNAPLQGTMNRAIEWMTQAYLAVSSHYLEDEQVQEIWLKLGDGEDETQATLETLDLSSEDGLWDYDFRSYPYNASEDNSTVRLKKFEAFRADLRENPDVDQRKISEAILEALGMEYALVDMEEVQAAAAAQAAQGGMPGAPPVPGAPLDPNASGLMPPEMEGAAGGEILAGGGEDLQPELPMASGGTIPLA